MRARQPWRHAAWAGALVLARSGRAMAWDETPRALRLGVLPLVFAVPRTAEHRFRRQVTVEAHATLGYVADAAGVGARIDVPLWPWGRAWYEIDSLAFSAGVDVLAAFAATDAVAWRVQVPLTFAYYVVLDRRLALFAETGATPEVRTGERPAVVSWPTLALGMRLQLGTFGPSEYGVGPPYRAPPGLLRPPTQVAIVVRVGFPAGLQVGAAF